MRSRRSLTSAASIFAICSSSVVRRFRCSARSSMSAAISRSSRGEAPGFQKSRACRPYGRQRRLERMGKRVEDRGSKLFGLPRRFGPALRFE